MWAHLLTAVASDAFFVVIHRWLILVLKLEGLAFYRTCSDTYTTSDAFLFVDNWSWDERAF